MEEAWELAVVSAVSVRDYSARHTRLRYQSVLSALLYALVATLEVKELQIPGFFKFCDTPPDWLLHLSAMSFAFYSMVSFFLQDRLEKSDHRSAKVDVDDELDYVSTGLEDVLDVEQSITKLTSVGRSVLDRSGSFKDGALTRKKPLSDSQLSDWRDLYPEVLQDVESCILLIGDVRLSTDRLTSYFSTSKDTSGLLLSRVRAMDADIVAARDLLIEISGLENGDLQRNYFEKLDALAGHAKSMAVAGQDKLKLLTGLVTETASIRSVHYWILPFLIPFCMSVLLIGIGIVFQVCPEINI